MTNRPAHVPGPVNADDCPGCVAATLERAERAEAAITRVRALHYQDGDYCAICTEDFGRLSTPWPCPTIQALDNQPEPASSTSPEQTAAEFKKTATNLNSATEPAPAGLREQIAAAIYERNNPAHQWANAHPDDLLAYGFDADAALAVILPGTRITATLARMSEADVQRVIDLYDRWVKAGPPPLGTPINRWWDTRLAELAAALNPTEQP